VAKGIELIEFWTVGRTAAEHLDPQAEKFLAEEDALRIVQPGQTVQRHGAQKDYVLGEEKYSAYIGGLGSGKTFAGLARGIRLSLQPKPKGVYHAPYGVIAASSYPALNDIIIPKLEEICDITGVANFKKDYRSAQAVRELTLVNGAVIRLRSLDNPAWQRGPEYAWFFIDEGRNVPFEAWRVLTARLRQKGYKRAGFVASTPNGFDWMYDVFHPDADLHQKQYPKAVWYNAATLDNPHLDEDYADSLGYSGRYYNQEILGQFVGIVEGGVFPEWDPVTMCTPLDFRPELPLYTMWDFGIGDPGICVFAQVEWKPTQLREKGPVKMFPHLYILGAIEAKDWTARDWANAYHNELKTTYKGVTPRGNYGDPAGLQRNPSTGTSVIQDLNSAGVPVSAVPKRPQDFAIRILQNMMAGDRVRVSYHGAKRVSDAFSSHKWHIKDGVRIGVNPVHDWTSHYVDAVRYGASVLLSFHPREETDEVRELFEPNQWGYVFKQMDEADVEEEGFFTGPRRRPTFIAPSIRGN